MQPKEKDLESNDSRQVFRRTRSFRSDRTLQCDNRLHAPRLANAVPLGIADAQEKENHAHAGLCHSIYVSSFLDFKPLTWQIHCSNASWILERDSTH